MDPKFAKNEGALEDAWHAQLDWAKADIQSALERGGTGDDGHDYLLASLELAYIMEDLRYEGDLNRWDALVNTEVPKTARQYDEASIEAYNVFCEQFEKAHGFMHLTQFACDGVCPRLAESPAYKSWE